MTRQRFRFRSFELRPDPMGRTTIEAQCVSGDEVECGAGSGELLAVPEVRQWVDAHSNDTGHRRYKLMTTDFALSEPGEWL